MIGWNVTFSAQLEKIFVLRILCGACLAWLFFVRKNGCAFVTFLTRPYLVLC